MSQCKSNLGGQCDRTTTSLLFRTITMVTPLWIYCSQCAMQCVHWLKSTVIAYARVQFSTIFLSFTFNGQFWRPTTRKLIHRTYIYLNCSKCSVFRPIVECECAWSRGQILRSHSRSRYSVSWHCSRSHAPWPRGLNENVGQFVFLKCNEWLQRTVWYMTFYWLFNNLMLIMMSRGDNLTDAE